MKKHKKKKYFFNPDTLSFEKLEISIKKKLVTLFSHFSASIVLATIFIIAFSSFFDTGDERNLKRDNEKLAFQYELLNKKLSQMELVLKDMQNRDDNIYRVVFEAEPIDAAIRNSGIGGVNRYAHLENFRSSDLMVETEKKLDNIAKKIVVQSKSFDDIIALAEKKEEMLACIPHIQPVSNKELNHIGSGFGMRMHPILKYMRMHAGIDFSAQTGSKVYATGNGTVEEANYSSGGYGNVIKINHGYGYMTVYGHLSRVFVKEGQKISRGELIGLVGSTGLSTAPHLHYEVHKNGEAVNPANYFFGDLTPEQYKQVLEMSANTGQSFD